MVENQQSSSSTSGGVSGLVFTQENAAAAAKVTGNMAKETAQEVTNLAKKGDFSIRIFGMLSGLALCVVSVLGLVGRILTFKWTLALLDVYTFCLGIIMLLLEARGIPFTSSFTASIQKYALFLQFVWGRGILYFVAGSLKLTQRSLLDLIVGAFVCFVGIMYILVGRRASRKLAQLKTSRFSEATLRAEFAEAGNGSGEINVDQFKDLLQSLNVDFNRRELEAAYLQVDKNESDKISFDEFNNWWSRVDHEVV